ncbi:hypothetical protein O181_027232 [Austropuccinia psidii MF-1]|uniref:Uncharacterized protein n=1 Tax=Austropuccinia psidii MF-1 TaxID=1389203 RepID=A0A9Q3CS78_9BASI|nr:hypothetical protein [Austropuccinia psidii MF-1]
MACLHLLWYLKGSQDYSLTYHAFNNHSIVAYRNADWGNCTDIRRLVSGYLISFKRFLVFRKARKKPTVSLPTSKVEYKSLCDVTSKLLWLWEWFKESSLSDMDSPTPVNEDNQGFTNMENGNININGSQMKHVDIQLHFAKEAIKNLDIELKYTLISDMLAEFLTKSACRSSLFKALNALGVLGIQVRGDVRICRSTD